METFLRHLNAVKRLFLAVTETGFALIGLIVLAYLLLGADAGPYVTSVVANLSLLIDAIGEETLIAIAIVLALGLALRRRP
ncbi:MAG: hypothetical protein ACKVPY_07060 [Paracoccaceae bacterium]